MSAIDEIAALLYEHQQSARNQRCSCGWRGDASKPMSDWNNIYAQHRKHLAEVLLAAGFQKSQIES